jgi:hypothetical protein
MSIEYFGTPVPALTADNIREVLDTISELDGITAVRRGEAELGIGFPENEKSGMETATIVLKSERVYVGFHACHGVQQARVIQFLESSLKKMGCICQLHEE